MADDLSLKVAGRQISGWTAVKVTAGIERCPRSFDIQLTERFPGESGSLVVQPGDPCQVLLGADQVINGYIDRFIPSIAGNQHAIRIIGRGKCQDLVDCAAEWPNSQISGSSVLGIAQKLAQPYGITVSADPTVDLGAPIPQFNIILTESAFEIIEKICRYRALLAYEGTDGNLVLSRVGTSKAASGFVQGENIQAASVTYAIDQRFSDYAAFLMSMDVLHDLGNGGNLLSTATDPNVKRHRKHVIIAEAGGGGADVTIQRVKWEAARRAGRAQAITLTTDSWRDGAGALWTPNTLVPVSIPVLKLQQKTYVVGEVTFKRDDKGTTADLLLMPPAAFVPEPVLLQPFPADVPALGPTAP